MVVGRLEWNLNVRVILEDEHDCMAMDNAFLAIQSLDAHIDQI